MKIRSKIYLSLEARFVLTCEVPALIADALYPGTNYLELPVIDLYKIRKQNIETKNSNPISLFFKKISTSKSVESWYEHLNSGDEEILMKHVWLHLPDLKFPMNMSEWHKYGEAFANFGSEISFELKPNRVEWTYEPNGNANEFYVLNRDARNKLGLIEEDLVSVENIAIQECGIAEFKHIGLLRDAIRCGDIEQLDPNSNIPTKTYLPYGRISLSAFTEYVKRFKLCVDNVETEPVSSTTEETTPVFQSHIEVASSSSVNPELAPQHSPKINTEAITPSNDPDWCVQARVLADECFDNDTKSNCRDSLATKNVHGRITGGYAHRVMVLMQQHGIKGPRGLIDNPATIMREALQGKKWWANKKK